MIGALTTAGGLTFVGCTAFAAALLVAAGPVWGVLGSARCPAYWW